MKDLDIVEIKKIDMNRLLFNYFRSDYFDISTVNELLNTETLPIEIKTNNNKVFIRDLTNYLIKYDLKPIINK